MELAAIGTSVISLLVAGTALYFSFFRRPIISAHVGPYIVVKYDGNGLSITIPSTFANQANQVGVVRRCALTLTHADSKQENFYMAWDSFRKLTSDGATWVQEGMAHAIPVLGRSTQTRNIEYRWENDSSPELKLREGTYRLRFDFWSEQKMPFTTVEHELRLSGCRSAEIEGTRVPRVDEGRTRHGVVYLTLDQEENKNRCMTLSEMERLL